MLVFLFILGRKFLRMLEKLLLSLPATSVIDIDGPYAVIDLSVKNKRLPATATAKEFEDFIDDWLSTHGARAAYGGYCEERNLYNRSTIFNDARSQPRNIHIGLDLWTKTGTGVLAALDGEVHSFNNNAGLGNYGPAIILSHTIDNIKFYTLYGHLTIESIAELEIGDRFKAGQQIATLGDASVNGDYAPHLHFQVIKELQGNFGDYPGVCTKTDLSFYLQNCPNPNLLLKLK